MFNCSQCLVVLRFSCSQCSVVLSVQLFSVFSCPQCSIVPSVQLFSVFKCLQCSIVLSVQLFPAFSCSQCSIVYSVQLFSVCTFLWIAILVGKRILLSSINPPVASLCCEYFNSYLLQFPLYLGLIYLCKTWDGK